MLPGKCDGVCDRQGEEVEQKLTRVTVNKNMDENKDFKICLYCLYRRYQNSKNRFSATGLKFT